MELVSPEISALFCKERKQHHPQAPFFQCTAGLEWIRLPQQVYCTSPLLYISITVLRLSARVHFKQSGTFHSSSDTVREGHPNEVSKILSYSYGYSCVFFVERCHLINHSDHLCHYDCTFIVSSYQTAMESVGLTQVNPQSAPKLPVYFSIFYLR